jgi:hypothetical protein
MMDDDVVLMNSKFTNIKERSDDKINTGETQALNCKRTAGPVSQTNKISLDLSDSDPELTDTSETCRRTVARLTSSIVDVEALTSKTSEPMCNVESVPSSPDSDSELLKPAFVYDCTKKISISSVAKRDKPVDVLDTVMGRGTDSCSVDSTVSRGAGVGRFQGSSKSTDDDVCLREPEKKKKRTKEEVEERKRQALVGGVSCKVEKLWV